MKYCRYCLNHGFRFYMSSDHINNCRLSQCVCNQCRTTPPQQYFDSKTLTIIPSEAQIETTPDEEPEEQVLDEEVMESDSNEMETNPIGGQSSVNVFESMVDPLETIKSFAQKLSICELSTNDLQNCVLYALLRSNDFSIEETKQELCQSRTAILESLVLPAFDCNRDNNLKRSRSTSNSKIATKKPMAKKSFQENRSNQTNDTNIPIDLMETTEQQSEVLVSKPQNVPKGTSSPTILVCTQTQTSITCVPKSSTNLTLITANNKPFKTIVLKPSVSTAIKSNQNNSLNLNKNVSKTATNSISKKPVQSVRPQICLSNTSTKVVSTISSTPITSFKPILLKSAKNYSNQKKTFNSLQQNIRRDETTTQKYNTIQNPNQIQIISGSNSTTSIDQFLSSLASNIKTYSKIRLTKSVVPTDSSVKPKESRLCSPVITTEAALVAISAVSNTSSTINESNKELELCSDNQMVSQTDSNESTEMFATNRNKNIGTTYSDQFKMFLNNSKEESIKPKKDNKHSKDIFEITID